MFCPNTLFRPFERFLEPAIYMIHREEYIQKARELVEEKAARRLPKKTRKASSCGSAAGAGVGGIGAVAGAGRIVVAHGSGSMEGWEQVQSIGIAIGIRT